MGGYVALEVMRHAPERVLAIALISTSARADAPDQAAARRVHLSSPSQAGSGRVGAYPRPAHLQLVG
jgi:homoserine acetyltransferase